MCMIRERVIIATCSRVLLSNMLEGKWNIHTQWKPIKTTPTTIVCI